MPPWIDLQTPQALLESALAHGCLSHAYLLVGANAPGLGKVFLQRLYCADSCGKCSACRKLARGAHPDVRWLRKSDKRISIDQIRELQHDALYPPAEAKRKVYIIDEAEALSLEAANSLLKLLEAPPDYVIFLLFARSLKLLPTIISRCQIIKIPALGRTQAAEQLRAQGFAGAELDWLTAFIAERPERLTEFAVGKLAPGLMAQAEQMRTELTELDDSALIAALEEAEGPIHQRELVLELLRRLPLWKPYQILEFALPLSKLPTERLACFWEAAIVWFRDLLLLSYGQPERIWNADRRQALVELLSRCHCDRLPQVIAELESSQGDFDGNANRQLLVESLLFKLASVVE